jgi:tripartite-type tricarboxylate transporter receptor subunit TctC
MQSGKIRAVAVTSLQRMPQLPDVAPLQDGTPGLKGYELLNWFGLFATGGTPADVVDKLNAVTLKTLAEPKTAKTLNDQGIVARKTSPAEFKSFVEAEGRKFGDVIEKAKIKLEN